MLNGHSEGPTDSGLGRAAVTGTVSWCACWQGGERRSWHFGVGGGGEKRRQAGYLTFTYKIKAP